jgi:hypothetical protein
MKTIAYWAPRILTILALIFMLMFSFDSLGGNQPLGQKLTGLLMHNIPVLILTAILIIAWKQEFIGGVLLLVAFGAASLFFKSFSGNPGSLIVILPFLIAGLLFILNHLLYSKPGSDKNQQ